MGESRPENEDRELFKERVHYVEPEDSLHLELALLSHLDHYQARVQVEQILLAQPLKLISVVLAQNVPEYFVEKESLLSLVTHLNVEEL